MNHLKTIVFLFLTCYTSFSFADSQSVLERPCFATVPTHHGTITVGATAGVTQGLGISMRHWFETNGYQLTLLPMIQLEENNQSIFVSASASWLHALWESPTYDFFSKASRNLVYSYTGLHYVVEKIKTEESSENTYRLDPAYFYSDAENRLQQDIFLGAGVGVQMNLSAIQLSLGVGYALSLHINRDWSPYQWTENYTYIVLHPTIDAKIGYTFGW